MAFCGTQIRVTFCTDYNGLKSESYFEWWHFVGLKPVTLYRQAMSRTKMRITFLMFHCLLPKTQENTIQSCCPPPLPPPTPHLSCQIWPNEMGTEKP